MGLALSSLYPAKSKLAAVMAAAWASTKRESFVAIVCLPLTVRGKRLRWPLYGEAGGNESKVRRERGKYRVRTMSWTSADQSSADDDLQL